MTEHWKEWMWTNLEVGLGKSTTYGLVAKTNGTGFVYPCLNCKSLADAVGTVLELHEAKGRPRITEFSVVVMEGRIPEFGAIGLQFPLTSADRQMLVKSAEECCRNTPMGNEPYVAISFCEPSNDAAPVIVSAGSIQADRGDKEARAVDHAMRDVAAQGSKTREKPIIFWLSTAQDMHSKLKTFEKALWLAAARLAEENGSA